MLVVGRAADPWLLHYVAHTGSRELFRLAVLAIALGRRVRRRPSCSACRSRSARSSPAWCSPSRRSAIRRRSETLPLRDAFAVLFFVSVGMLFDPCDPRARAARRCWRRCSSSWSASRWRRSCIVLAFRHPLSTALTISASLAQIGEFSFILASARRRALACCPTEGQDLILAAALISIMINPFLFSLSARVRSKAAGDAEGETAAKAPASTQDDAGRTALQNHAVLVGYGRVGSLIGAALRDRGMPFLVVEESRELIDTLRKGNSEVIAGTAGQPGLLEAANLAGARWLIIAIPSPFETGDLVERARKANPAIRIIARAHSDAEVEYLRKLGADQIVLGEREIANEMTSRIVRMEVAGSTAGA